MLKDPFGYFQERIKTNCFAGTYLKNKLEAGNRKRNNCCCLKEDRNRSKDEIWRGELLHGNKSIINVDGWELASHTGPSLEAKNFTEV